MSVAQYAPIVIMIFICAFCVASAVIMNIRSRKSLLNIEDDDFITMAIKNKKRSLDSNMGGVTWKEYLITITLIPIAFGVLGYMFVTPKSLCVLFAFLGFFVPDVYIKVSEKKNEKKFEELYAQALRALASSLRSGLSIEQSIDAVGSNPFIDEKIRNSFKQISTDIKVGIPLEDAFRRFAKETHSKDAEDVASAIAMQSKVGGSESQVIQSIAANINDRIMMRKEVKTLFADTSILVLVMDFLPWVVLAALYYAAYEFIAPYFETFSNTMILIGIMVFTSVGSIVIHKLAKDAKGG